MGSATKLVIALALAFCFISSLDAATSTNNAKAAPAPAAKAAPASAVKTALDNLVKNQKDNSKEDNNRRAAATPKPKTSDQKAAAKQKAASDAAAKQKKRTDQLAQSKKTCNLNGKTYNVGSAWTQSGFQCKCVQDTKAQRAVVQKVGCVLPTGKTLAAGSKQDNYQCTGSGDSMKLVQINGNKKTTTSVKAASQYSPQAQCRQKKCNIKAATVAPTCHASGDPHYTTFDGQLFHYQGTCKLTAVKPIKTSKYNFTVAVQTEYRAATTINPNAHMRVSFVKMLEVTAYGQVFTLGLKGKLQVNGVNTTVPYFYPPFTGDACATDVSCQVAILPNGNGLSLSTDYGLAASYDGNQQFYISVPNDGSMKSNVQGLCGDYNGNKADDFKYPNGTFEKTNFNPFGDSWIIVDAEANKGCVRFGNEPPQTCDPKVEKNAKEMCSVLLDKNGPFDDCYSKANLSAAAQAAYDNCVFDVCFYNLSDSVRCTAMEAFVGECQRALNGAALDWRDDDFCPMKCPTGMHYDASANPCPATCTDPDGPDVCTAKSSEGCECDAGLVKDGEKCVKPDTCGCLDDENNYHGRGETWLGPQCTGQCTCKDNGTTQCVDYSCAAPYVCTTVNGQRGCGCAKGYKADAKGACQDVDECASDPNVCGPDATCRNVAGSFDCQCKSGLVRDGNTCRALPPAAPACGIVKLEQNPPANCHYEATIQDNGCPSYVMICTQTPPPNVEGSAAQVPSLNITGPKQETVVQPEVVAPAEVPLPPHAPPPPTGFKAEEETTAKPPSTMWEVFSTWSWSTQWENSATQKDMKLEPPKEQPVAPPVAAPLPGSGKVEESPAPEPAETPAEPKPVEQPKPEEPKPVEQPKPEEPKPVEQPKPEEPKPEEPKPEEPKPVEQPKPEEPKPEEPKPEEPKPVEQPKPEEPKPEEPKPEEPKPVEQPKPEPEHPEHVNEPAHTKYTKQPGHGHPDHSRKPGDHDGTHAPRHDGPHAPRHDKNNVLREPVEGVCANKQCNKSEHCINAKGEAKCVCKRGYARYDGVCEEMLCTCP